MNNTSDRIRSALRQLKLASMGRALDACLERAQAGSLSHLEFLAEILESEVAGRATSAQARRLAAAHLPVQRTLEEFDFAFQTSLKQATMTNLAECRWIEHAANLLFEGPPGVGKTHLAIALGHQAVERGYRVRFIEAEDLLQQMYAHAAAGEIERYFKKLAKYDCIIIDEFAYLPLDAHAGNYLFQLVSRCYETVSLVITSNKGIEAWGEMFQDQAIAQAILDRFLHHCDVLRMSGESYRLKGPDRKTVQSRKRKTRT